MSQTRNWLAAIEKKARKMGILYGRSRTDVVRIEKWSMFSAQMRRTLRRKGIRWVVIKGEELRNRIRGKKEEGKAADAVVFVSNCREVVFVVEVARKGKPLGKAVKQIEDILQDVPAFLQGAGVSTPFNPRRDVVPVVVGCSHKGCSRQKKEVKNKIPVYTRGLTETLDPRVRELLKLEQREDKV
ncbi:MAG: hypothetical protein DRP63_06260 [Planctomycetota bacterium]|nr:MAG: hypothetical protein DRP63_06260 [Planctomycetota bacterium]